MCVSTLGVPLFIEHFDSPFFPEIMIELGYACFIEKYILVSMDNLGLVSISCVPCTFLSCI